MHAALTSEEEGPPDPLRALREALRERYAIERELGAGGMATVFLARDLKHDRPVALKLLRADVADAVGPERFLAEIKTTASLQHPHILPLFDSGRVGRTVYYAMPYVRGETLRGRMQRERQLPMADAVRIARQVADALHHAHGLGIIHRDIKPENILLNGEHAVVADFGIALATTAAGARLTETGLSIGTPTYMSPEQAMGERQLDARSDIYALGCVVYEMLAGDPPHVASTMQGMIAKILAERPSSLTLLRDTVPPYIDAAVSRALAKLPADRFPTAAAFGDSLMAPTDHAPTPGTGHGPVAGSRSWLADWRSRGAIGLALVGLGGAVWEGRQQRASAPLDEYDVGLPDEATFSPDGRIGFSVSPDGDFVVYRAVRNGSGELWKRSLRDGSVRRIDGTEGAELPAISPDGRRLAFLRATGDRYDIVVLPLTGGMAVSVVAAEQTTDLHWLPDGRLLEFAVNGSRVRWLSASGGVERTVSLRECVLPSLLDRDERLLCGGGASAFAHVVSLKDPSSTRLITDGAGRPVYGTQFRLIEPTTLAFVSKTGDLMVARFDPARLQVGQLVPMARGLARREYSGAATYEVSSNGTLVLAFGENRAVGSLVRTNGSTLDTLPLRPDAFLSTAMSPDGRRLSATVDQVNGVALRIYDLEARRQFEWVRRATLTQPVWNPRGDSLAFGAGETLFVGSPDRTEPPRAVGTFPDAFVPHAWSKDGQLIGVWTRSHQLGGVTLGAGRPVVDTMRANASFPALSPNGRWLAYADAIGAQIWVEPVPANGSRFAAVDGGAGEPLWYADDELAVGTYDARGEYYDRVRLQQEQQRPLGQSRRWVTLRHFRDTPGPSVSMTPDRKLLYLQGGPDRDTHYFRVIARWRERVRAALDSAASRGSDRNQ